MIICVFDTETTSVEKPFVYNIGYLLYDTEQKKVVLERDYVVEQVWHNPMLFTTAYYADKRTSYINAMRGRNTLLDKFGHITQRMYWDFKAYEVTEAYAYNSSFDERVFRFNCDWFKCINPFDDVRIHDIRGYAHHFLVDNKFKAFCELHEFFTESGNYSTTAETLYRYITDNVEFIEAHTALNDSQIECQILEAAIAKGASLEQDYQAMTSVPRITTKTLTVLLNKREILSVDYEKIRMNRNKTKLSLTDSNAD